MTEKKTDEAIEILKQNRGKIESLNFRLAEQDKKLADQDNERLLDDIDDLKNRSLHKTLIFKNTPYNSNNENSWNDTKTVLAAEIAEVLPNTTSEVTVNFIERAHHIQFNYKKRKNP